MVGGWPAFVLRLSSFVVAQFVRAIPSTSAIGRK